MSYKYLKTPFIKAGFIALAVAIGTIQLGIQATASNANSLYRYDLQNVQGTTVPNTATSNTTATMQLAGSWTATTQGTVFNGNLTSLQSVGYAKPTNGSTLSVAPTQSIGAAVIFSPNALCEPDSQNMSQIGPFAAGVSQVKLQLSKCTNGNTYPECRIAGSATPVGTGALRSTMVLAQGNLYRLGCTKSPDNGATAEVTMRVDNLTANTSVVSTMSIPATGTISSTAYVTAGNKYPLPTQSKNTDQYKGLVRVVGYCQGTSVSVVEECLSQDVAFTPVVTTSNADEIKYMYGNTRDEIVISWRGQPTTVYYGLTDSYGSELQGSQSAITPVDMAGPFYEARVSGLTLGATYHYKVGVDGQDRTFTVAAGDNDSFKAVAIGDTIASTCRSYQTELNQLAGAIQPQFVLHHGDIAIANECGTPATHQYFLDIEASYANAAAYMPTWGNHEYGQPTANAPAGTPRDSLANYKGRIAIPNAQTVPNDTATKTTHPGCGSEIGSTTNTCMGEDWGWFRTGRVLFISVPELWPSAITDWQAKVAPLMLQAQNDPTIDFVVTYGHRPLLSSTSYAMPTGYDAVFTSLSDTYGPSTNNPNGKYVLNLTGHRHGLEAFGNYHGVTHIVNGGGGQGLISFGTPLAGSDYRAKHLGFSTLEYDAPSHTLTFKIVCGPSYSAETTTCTPGSTLYEKSYIR